MFPGMALATSACSAQSAPPATPCLYTFNEPSEDVSYAGFVKALISPEGNKVYIQVASQLPSSVYWAGFPLGTSAGLPGSPYYFNTTSGLLAFEVDIILPSLPDIGSPAVINNNIEIVSSTYDQLLIIHASTNASGVRTISVGGDTPIPVGNTITRVGVLIDFDAKTFTYRLNENAKIENVPLGAQTGYSATSFIYVNITENAGIPGAAQGLECGAILYADKTTFLDTYPSLAKTLCDTA